LARVLDVLERDDAREQRQEARRVQGRASRAGAGVSWWWPWAQRAERERMQARVSEIDAAELQRRRDAIAADHLMETKRRIAAHWAAREQELAARRVLPKLTFASHLVPATEHQPLRPLKWGAR
jgi:hypothetical protein